MADIAQRDALTSAFNRRALREDLDRVLEESRAERQPVTLALLDLDHFKAVNDQYGHDEGDRVLVELVHVVRSTLRQHDRLYRIGGEEFVVVLTNTDRTGAEAALEKLHAALREQLKGPAGTGSNLPKRRLAPALQAIPPIHRIASPGGAEQVMLAPD